MIPCTLSDAGLCENHGVVHFGHLRKLATELTAKAEAYRRHWDALYGTRKAKPLLRSLPLAKQCQHLGSQLTPEEAKQHYDELLASGVKCNSCGGKRHEYHCSEKKFTNLALCSTCTLWKPSSLRSEQAPSSEHHENPASRAGYSWREPIRFDQHNLSPHLPDYRFNPSIIASGDGFIFVFRTGWVGSQIYAIRLDREFNVAGESKLLQLRRNGCGWGREDPRLFRLNGKLHMMYIGVIGKRGPTNVLFCRINEETLEVEDNFFPQGFKRNRWEKNWQFFDYQGTAYAVYDINPHKILRIEGSRAEFVHETPYPGTWSGGYLRGGASPVLHNGEWYSFFHGKWDNHRARLPGQSTECKRRHVYTVGVYTFSPEPPFNVLRWCPHPIEVAEPDMTDGNYADVVFNCGAVLHDGQWAISMGRNDRRSEIRFYPEAWIESQLITA